MDAKAASLELLAHFDGPVARETTCPAPMRGVGWVLQWFAALVTLFVAVTTLAQFGYCLAAELALQRAARAGVLEATLPRATYQSVAQTVERRLVAYPRRADRLRLSFQQNGAPIRGAIQSREGDLFCVTLSVPAREMLPRWLRPVCFWRADSQIEASAERKIPGRQLPSP
jgi:hypothetical protein